MVDTPGKSHIAVYLYISLTVQTTLGPFLGPILAAYIVQGTGNWYWIFEHLAIVLGMILIYM
jgi:MFS family permease